MRSTRPRYAARHRWRRKKAAGSQAALLIAGLVASLPLALVPADRSWAEAPAPQLDLALDLPTFAARAERPLHLGRALLETTGILVGGTIWYWRDLEFNTRDWDLQWDRPSWRRKLTGEALRFDQNLFQTNAVSHPRAGVAHYQVARGNGLGLAGSAAATLASSAFWEYVVEFKEHPAANDLIVNTVAGVAIGEPFYQLGEFFLRSRPTLWSRGLAAALSPVASANDWIDARRIPFESYDRYGFTTEVAHRFHLTAGYQQRTFDAAAVRAETSLGLGAELVMLPRYGRPGRFARWIEPGDWSSVDGRLDIGPYGVTGGSLLTRTTVLGYYAQSFARTAGRQIDGRGLKPLSVASARWV